MDKKRLRKLAKALSVNSITGPQTIDERGKEYFEFEVIAKDCRGPVRIYKFSDTELTTHKLLGEAEGQSFFHCIFMGRNVKNFHNRVCGYQVLNSARSGMSMRVAFYEKA